MKKIDQLLEKQDKLLEEVEFYLEAFQNESPIRLIYFFHLLFLLHRLISVKNRSPSFNEAHRFFKVFLQDVRIGVDSVRIF